MTAAHGVVPYFCRRFKTQAVRVLPGAHYVTQGDEMIVTLLGSCVAACIRDPAVGIGGLNHFMLPGLPHDGKDAAEAPLRYGSVAMEWLINDILKRGGQRSRLEVKVFGGGNILIGLREIGKANEDFVIRYLKEEGFRIAARDLGGTRPRRIHYFPGTGKVMVATLRATEERRAIEEEHLYRRKLIAEPMDGGIELFD
jgi:chemotaxis protein CheD